MVIGRRVFSILKKENCFDGCPVMLVSGADLDAKAALNLSGANLGMSYTDLKFHIDRYNSSS